MKIIALMLFVSNLSLTRALSCGGSAIRCIFEAPIREVDEEELQSIGVQETIQHAVETPVRPQRVQGPYQIVEEVQQIQQPQPVQQVPYQLQPQPQQYFQPQPVQQAVQPQYYQPQQVVQPQYYQPQQVVQPQYYQPAAAAPAAAPASYGGGTGGFLCFSADTLVHTSQGKDVRMDELKLDDFVLAKQGAKLSYLPVKSWLHRLPKQNAEFQKIELDDGTILKLTNLHYIYTTTCDKVGESVDMGSVNDKAVRAEEVKEGECVYQVKGEQNSEYLVKTRVISNMVVNGTGIYAPLTPTGDIFVNKVHASCHAVLHSNAIQSTFFGASNQKVNRIKTFIKQLVYHFEANNAVAASV